MASNDETPPEEELILKERAKSAFRYTEDIAPGLRLDMELRTILHSSLSDFQEVQVIESYFGKTLVTDGKTQSAEHDERVYHESLVHPAMFWSALLAGDGAAGGSAVDASVPKKVFIGGGGELATAREVLRHDTLERVVMVDIDPMVVDVCKKYLPEWGGEAVTSHPKMELIIGDAHKYLMETEEKFDVIIMDISDPIEAGPGIALYTREFYKRASEILTPNGVFVTQAGCATHVPHPYQISGDATEASCFAPITNTLASVFDHAVPYSVPLASFGEDWGFVMAFNGPACSDDRLRDLVSSTVDALIEERIGMVPRVPAHWDRSKGGLGKRPVVTGKERGAEVLVHYDGISHRAMFALSKPLRKILSEDERIMTVENPIFMY